MSGSNSGNTSEVRVSDRLGDAFSRFEEEIRAKAYQMSRCRDPGRGDPVADWLEAEAELLEPVDVEVKEQKKNTVVEVKLKGFSPEDIEVEVAGNTLRIFGSHGETSTKKKKNGRESTTKTQSFFRSVPLEMPVDLDHCHAKLLKNGKLKVVLPKKLEDKPGKP